MMKKQLLKPLKLAAALLLAAALPSCLQNETTLSLNKDGSGTIVEETYLTAAMLEMSGQFAQPGAPDPVAEMFTEEKAKEKAAKLGEGVEFVKMEMIEKEGSKGARTHYKFADINTVTLNPGSAMESLGGQALEPAKDDESVKFKFADGKLDIVVPPTDFDEMSMSDKDDAEQNPEMEEMMKKLMADMRLTIRLTAPGGIEKTNATYTEGNTVTLFDVEVGKMLAQKDKLKAIAETAKTDKDAALADFKKLEGMKVETTENVSVTLK